MLYRKYRPQKFDEVISQNHIKITIQNQIKTDKLGHAYLFCGPRAVGKTTLARIVAKTINCENRKDDTADACNNCSVCKEINKSAGLDIIEIDAASHTGVDNVRENIINLSQVAPAHYKYKVFIIDEVHMLSTQAFNALLKTIEEPPNYIVFILCTTETHKVPLTIISRCQRFDFKKIGVSDITKKLESIANEEKIKIEKSVLESIARQSGGHMRDAESLLSQVIAISNDDKDEEITMDKANLIIPRSDLTEAIDLVDFIFKKHSTHAIRLVNKIVNEGVDLKLFTGELIEILRKIMLAKTDQTLAEKLSLELGEEHEKKISEISKDINVSELIKIIERFNVAKQELNEYPIPQLALELAIIELNNTQSKPNIQQPAVTNAPNIPKITPPPQTHNTQHVTRNIPNIQAPITNNTPQVQQTTQEPIAQSVSPVAPTSNQPNTQTSSPAAVIPTQTGNVTIESINERWKDLLTTIQQTNPSVSFILRACQAQSLTGNELTLAFKYKFHEDQISRPEIKSLIIEILQKIYGQNFTIETLLNDKLEINGAPTAQKPIQAKPVEQNTNVETTAATTQASTPNQPIEKSDANDKMTNNILDTFDGKVIN